MGLERKNTRFGLRGATPGSDDETNDSRSLAVEPSDGSLKKSRKGIWADETPSKMRQFSQDRDGVEAGSGLKSLYLPQPAGNVRVKDSSPWESLTKNFSLILNGNDSVTIASQKDGRFVAVREFSGRDANRKVNMIQKIEDKNFIAFLDRFSFEGSYYVVFEHEITYTEHGVTYWEKFPVTLRQYGLINRYPTEQQLATILRQILDGLKYLASRGLEHGALTCNNVLIGTQGSIKIAGQECCRELVSNRGSIRDIKGVGYVTWELMHKEAKYDGDIEVRDGRRWPRDSKAVNFLLKTKSAYSIDELIEHPLFSYERQKISLKANVYVAEFSVFRGYDIIP